MILDTIVTCHMCIERVSIIYSVQTDSEAILPFEVCGGLTDSYT